MHIHHCKSKIISSVFSELNTGQLSTSDISRAGIDVKKLYISIIGSNARILIHHLLPYNKTPENLACFFKNKIKNKK